MLFLIVAAVSGPALAAPAARNSPDAIICAITESCDASGQPAANQRIKVGDERAFSLSRPGATQSPATPPRAAMPSAAPDRVRVAERTPVRRPRAKPATATAAPGAIDMQVSFGLGSAEMTEQAKAEARAFATAMQSPALSTMRFSIDGHTDAIGNRDYNLDLSRRRAQAVVDYLAAQGVDAARLEPKGFGFDRPRPGAAPRAPVNRRVEFSKIG